eukprot:1393868-Amorphochlora_amoeboformis.AAC.5
MRDKSCMMDYFTFTLFKWVWPGVSLTAVTSHPQSSFFGALLRFEAYPVRNVSQLLGSDVDLKHIDFPYEYLTIVTSPARTRRIGACATGCEFTLHGQNYLAGRPSRFQLYRYTREAEEILGLLIAHENSKGICSVPVEAPQRPRPRLSWAQPHKVTCHV